LRRSLVQSCDTLSIWQDGSKKKQILNNGDLQMGPSVLEVFYSYTVISRFTIRHQREITVNCKVCDQVVSA